MNIKYRITNGRGAYIDKDGKLASLNKAFYWENKNKATNVIISLSKKYQRLAIEEIEINEMVKTEVEIKFFEFDKDFEIMEFFKELQESVKNIEKRKVSLNMELSIIDCKLSHIQHTIEFEKLNAIKLSKIVRLQKKRMIERRILKNELQIIENILNRKITSESIYSGIHGIESMENRTYTPKFADEELLQILE